YLHLRLVLRLSSSCAARVLEPSLLDAGVCELISVNRPPERADALADTLGKPGRVHARYLSDLPALGDFGLLINATSAARGGQLPQLPMSLLSPRCTAVDLSYGEASIPFLAWARAHGAHEAVDGLGMLVEQAAESFALWHGVRPHTDDVYAELHGRQATLVTAD